MTIHNDVFLKPYHTFAVGVYARYMAAIGELSDLEEAAAASQKRFSNLPILVLGGGSNLLFRQNFDGLILHNQIKGITLTDETDSHVWVRAMGGESWDDLVQHCVTNQWGGIENLSLIPGSVGAASIQNIGAYGTELADVFHSAEAIHLPSGQCNLFLKSDCAFGYRDSFFKRQKQGEYCIYALTLCLSKKPLLRLDYGDISKTLAMQGIGTPNLQAVRNAVCTIRQSKLPDPKKLGNAGSFFKNPEISTSQYLALKEHYPNIPAYPVGPSNDAEVRQKIPAAWLIEQCGLKGKRIGDVGTHTNHALVLVNYGSATGNQIYDFALTIIESVRQTFGINLTPEVNII